VETCYFTCNHDLSLCTEGSGRAEISEMIRAVRYGANYGARLAPCRNVAYKWIDFDGCGAACGVDLRAIDRILVRGRARDFISSPVGAQGHADLSRLAARTVDRAGPAEN